MQTLARVAGWTLVLLPLAAGPDGPTAVVGEARPAPERSGPEVAPGGPGGSGPGVSRGRQPPADTLVFRDDAGRRVALPEPPRRLVSLVPAVTELVFALDAGDRLVGRTRYGVHPPRAREVPSVGGGVRPSAELVRARRPDLIVMYAGPENRASLREFDRLDVPVLAVEHDVLADLYRNVERLGRVLGRESRAAGLTRALRCQLAHVARRRGRLDRRSVYYEVWGDPPVTVGAGSYLDSLLTLAGGRNVFGDLEAPSPRVSLEAVVERQPEVILIPETEEGAGRVPPAERPGWSAVAAVRRGDVRRVDGDLVHRLGPRVGEAAAELARALHPGATPGVDPAAACPAPEAGGPAPAGRR